MSTWNAIYLRGDVPPNAASLFEGEVPIRSVGPWTEVALYGVQSGEAAALALSAQVRGEVIWILIQTTASVLAVVHCENGAIVRVVEFADGSWRRVEGAPRPWEAALFSPEALERALDDGGDEAELRAAFAARVLEVGSQLPWPREYDAMWNALGLTEREWMAARQQPPLRTIVGTVVPRGTLALRLLLALGIALLLGAVMTHGDTRAVLGALGLPVILLALLGALLRRVQVGRWFS